MVRVKTPKSKRMSSKQRHKIERKKREHKRDLKKAAKALKAKGLGPKRSKKTREMAKLALQVSNSNPDKEKILQNVLSARERARVEKAQKRTREEPTESSSATPVAPSTTRNVLFFPGAQGGDFAIQFTRSLSELVFPDTTNDAVSIGELPSAAYLITLDSRFAVQSAPWTLLDAIVDQARSYTGDRKVLLLFVLTKMELVSTAALVSQFSLLAVELCRRYPMESLQDRLVCCFTPFSTHHHKLQRHLIRMLNQFRDSDGCKSHKMVSNLDNKLCVFVIGLPNTGRRSLCRVMSSEGNQSSVSAVPLRAAQLQLSKNGDDVDTKFAFPNAKSITLVTFPEDHRLIKELRDVSGADILFRSENFVERCPDPEHIACALFEGIYDKVTLFQAFCQPMDDRETASEDLKVAERFLRGLGRTVRQEKGFHVSPLLVSSAGTMGRLNSSSLTAHVGFTSAQQQSRANLLDATYSNATPSKLIRISSVIHTPHKRGARSSVSFSKDARNVYRLGSRTFIREMCQSRHVPWAILRAPSREPLSREEVEKACSIYNVALLSGKKWSPNESKNCLESITESLSSLMKDLLVFLPHQVIEMYPDAVAPPQYRLTDDEESSDSDDPEEEGEEEEEEEASSAEDAESDAESNN